MEFDAAAEGETGATKREPVALIQINYNAARPHCWPSYVWLAILAAALTYAIFNLF